MPSHRLLLFAALVALAISAAAEKPIATTVCEIARRPQDFDGKMVRVRAQVLAGFEVFALRDGDCGRIWLRYPEAGAFGATTSFGVATPQIERPAIELRRDRAFRRFAKLIEAEMYPRDPKTGCMSCLRYEVTATMTGRLDWAGEGRGFGHMNGYPAQLVLQSVTNVSAKDRAPEFGKEYSTRPVRHPQGTIHGTLLDAGSKPMPSQQVFAIDAGPDAAPMPASFDAYTDEQGRFRIEVPPGVYIVGINTLWSPSSQLPYPRTFVDGASTESEARRIRVADRQNVPLQLRLGAPLVPKRITVSVTWPDGTPVADANVWLQDVEYGEHNVVGISVSHTNANGQVTLLGFEGREYVIHANIYVKPFYRPHCAPLVRVGAEEPAGAVISMRLSMTGEVCR